MKTAIAFFFATIFSISLSAQQPNANSDDLGLNAELPKLVLWAGSKKWPRTNPIPRKADMFVRMVSSDGKNLSEGSGAKYRISKVRVVMNDGPTSKVLDQVSGNKHNPAQGIPIPLSKYKALHKAGSGTEILFEIESVFQKVDYGKWERVPYTYEELTISQKIL